MKNVSKQNQNTLAGNNLFVEIGKKISYSEVPLESKTDILSNLLPEYVGMKKVRIIIDKFKEAEKLKSEVIVHWKDGKIYSICNGEDNKPCFVEVKTNIADVKAQVMSIVSEYLASEDVDEFMQKYLLAVAETTAFSDEIEMFISEVKEALEQLKTNEILNLDKKLHTLINKRIEHCNNIIAEYGCKKEIIALTEELAGLIIQIAGDNVLEKEYYVLQKFVIEISKAIDKLTLSEADYEDIESRYEDDLLSSLDDLNVVPDFIPESYEYLDGSVLEHNYRVHRTIEGVRGKGETEAMKWISARVLADGTYVEGFWASYAIYSNPPHGQVSSDIAERYDTFDAFATDNHQKPLSFLVGDMIYLKEENPKTRDFITEEQYKAIVELNEELGYNAITMWPSWIIPRGKKDAYSKRKLIEKKDGKFVIAEKPEEYGEQSHAVYLVYEK
mgnify:CR=1 FL=1